MTRTKSLSKVADLPILLILVVGATALRVFHLGTEPLWLDEAFTAAIVKQPFGGLARSIVYEPYTLAYFLLLWPYARFGTSEVVLRSFSVIAGVLTVPAVYLLGRRLFNQRVGIIAAALMAVVPAQIKYAHDARAYTLFILIATIDWLLFLNAIEKPRLLEIASLTMGVVLASYTHFFGLFLLPAMGICIIATRQPKHTAIRFSLAGLCAALLLAPIPVFFMTLYRGQAGWIPRERLTDLINVLARIGGGLDGYSGELAAAICGIGAIAALDSMRRSARARGNVEPFIIVLAGFAVPVVGAAVVSLKVPMLIPRYLALCAPSFAVLAAVGFDRLLASRLMMPVLVVFVILTARQYYDFFYFSQNDQSDAATAYIMEHAKCGDSIVFMPPIYRYAFQYYRDRRSGSVCVPSTINANDNLLDGERVVANRDDIFPRDIVGALRGEHAENLRVWEFACDACFLTSGRSQKRDTVRAAVSSVGRLVARKQFVGIVVSLHGGDGALGRAGTTHLSGQSPERLNSRNSSTQSGEPRDPSPADRPE
jgi:mannosyltransferase